VDIMVTDEIRWRSIEERDPEATFLYGVSTTGVYCHPSCPSRRPRRENATTFDTVEAAEAAGFRACKRCRPNGDGTTGGHTDLVARACRIIETSASAPDLATLAAKVGMSPFHFHRVFKAATGVTPKIYGDGVRDERMRELLAASDNVTDAIYDAGFGSTGHVYATAIDRFGMTPRTYGAGAPDETIRVAVGESTLGAILVAATDKGICSIQFGDDPDDLLRDLQDRFPHADVIGGDPAFEVVVASVVALVEHSERAIDLPLDIRGTVFQQRVWQALLDVAPGETITYHELAERIGAPRSSRAVAGACAANQLAVAIPCHRVVRTDGSLSGYRWGVDRKRALLEHEHAI
jgi:AraC family transcriptional regulator of adaptative response/methylated-DNA-[protein]-cysteine methyltransferase